MELPERRNPQWINEKYDQQLFLFSVPLFLSDIPPSAKLFVRLEVHQIDHVHLCEIKAPLTLLYQYLLLFIMKVYIYIHPISLAPILTRLNCKFKLVLLLSVVPFPMLLIFLSFKQTWFFTHYLIFYQIFYCFGKRRLILASINLVLWWSPLMWQW